MEFSYPKLKGYTYLETLGEGGQGKVIKVKDPSRRRVYGLKLLSPSQSDRAEAEIKALQKLNHKNILSIYDAEFTNNGAYILMQYMKHGNIQQHLQKEKLDIADKLYLIQDVAEALAYVHREGFIHRDIKPQNIFITDDGEGLYACLGDFGIVKELGATTLTKTGAGVGTMLYSPCEVLNGTEKLSHQSDVYALGMSMYEVLTGKHAYDISNPVMFFQELAQKEIIRPSSCDSLIVELVDEFCLKSIAKNKEDRFETVEEFNEELKKCIEIYENQEDEDDEEEEESEVISISDNMSIDELLRKALHYSSAMERDYEKMRECYELAGAKGSVTALEILGWMYDNGEGGVEQNYVKAREYYEKAAEKGHADALLNLGTLYADDHGVRRDFKKTKEYHDMLKKIREGK